MYDARKRMHTHVHTRARTHTRSHTHQGVDLVGLCLQQQQTPDTSPAPGATGSLIPQDGSAYAESYMDIQGITDCTVLETVVDHACAFKTRLTSVRRGSAGIEMDTRADNGQKGRQTPPREAASSTSVRRGSAGAASSAASTAAAPSSSAPAGWGASMNTHVRASRGYTLEFWMKIDATTRIPENNGDYQANPTSMRRLVFFSRVSPPRVIATLSLRSAFNDVEFTAYSNCGERTNSARVSINFPKATPLQPGMWFKISMVYGAVNKYGKRGIQIVEGCVSAFQYMQELDWCDAEDDLIQAIQLPGGVLMSPIEVDLEPVGFKHLQEKYYKQADKIKVRRVLFIRISTYT